MPLLTRRALNRALLARQHLLAPAALGTLPAVAHLYGLQAQAPMPPYYALWTRLAGFDPDTLAGLITGREVVRATAMRGTIHALTAADYRVLRPLVQPTLNRLLTANHGAALAGLDPAEVAAAGRDLLAAGPMTAQALGARLQTRWADRPAGALAMAVSCLEPLVQVPPRGLWNRSGAPSFTTAAGWLGPDGPGSEPPGPAVAVRRYLAAYGPASVRDMQSWAGLTGLGPVFGRLREELVGFRDGTGTELFDLPAAQRPDPDTVAPPRLLADFDTVLLGHADRTRIISDAHRRRVFTVNGIIRSTFTVDGFVHGMWALTRPGGRGGGTATVTFTPFSPVPTSVRQALTAEAHRVAVFAAPHAADVAVTFADPA